MNDKKEIYLYYLAFKEKGIKNSKKTNKELLDIFSDLYDIDIELLKEIIKTYSNHSLLKFEENNIKRYSAVDFEKLNLFRKYLSTLSDRTFNDIKRLEYETLSIANHLNVNNNVDNFKIKGLVIGDIQSGKTASMIGLMNAAFDLGYKRVIILTGLINEMREQTNERVNEAFEIDGKNIANYFKLSEEIVNQTINGEINLKNILGYKSNENRSTFWITKKNINALNSLNTLFLEYKEDATLSEKLNEKTLIIDDEADLASQDNSNKKSTDVSKTNKKIIELINRFRKVAYVGYTATPFANLLTDRNKTHNDTSLYPDNFISIISPGDSYTGFNTYLQKYEESDSFYFIDESKFEKLKTEEFNELHKNEDFLNTIISYLVSATLLKLKEIRNENSKIISSFKTLMINIEVKNVLQKNIENETFKVINRFKSSGIKEYEKMIKSMIAKNSKWNNLFYENQNEFWETFTNIIKKINVELVNKDSDSKVFILDKYEEEKYLIAIGGYKLSRGITVPGLITTLFYRSTNSFDSAMQMCRWYGYRNKYIDFSTVHLSYDSWTNYITMFQEYEDFKKDLLNQYEEGLTAEDFIIKIRTIDKLSPTQLNKMKGAKIIRDKISKTGRNQIFNYILDKEIQKSNIKSIISNIKELEFKKYNPNYICENVDFSTIRKILEKLVYEDRAGKFIREKLLMINEEEKDKKWDIVIKTIHNESNGNLSLSEKININLSKKIFDYSTKNLNNNREYEIGYIKAVLTTDIENYLLEINGENISQRNFIKSTLLDSQKSVLFLTFNKFVHRNDRNEIIDYPIVCFGLYTPIDRQKNKFSQTVYINESGSIMTEKEFSDNILH